MSYFGVLKKVYDNQTKSEPHKDYWGLVIDTEAKGEVTFNLWDCTMAGRTSAKGEEPVFDVHEAIERRVMFDCQPGKAKPGGGNYPANITLIQYAEDAALPPIGTLLADEGRDARVEASMGAAQFVAVARQHMDQALVQIKAAEEMLKR